MMLPFSGFGICVEVNIRPQFDRLNTVIFAPGVPAAGTLVNAADTTIVFALHLPILPTELLLGTAQ